MRSRTATTRWSWLWQLGRIAVALGAGVGALLLASPSATAQSASGGTVVTTARGPFGTYLVVGSGTYAGYSLYFVTSDQPGHYGCDTQKVTLPQGQVACTGPSNDTSAEWPAITTSGAPVAQGGVQSRLLGSVNRSGIGDQITYAGHPLYLFDMGPSQITGEGWDEPSLPPWHGVWWLMSPSGRALAWPGMLTTTTINHKTVLGAMMLTLVGWKVFPVYSYSKDTSSTIACKGSCAVAWPPLLTSGGAGVSNGLSTGDVRSIKRPDGTKQVTYNGHPLYFYGSEGIVQQGMNYVATGNGNGIKVGHGSFKLIKT